jgi:hypothetical protein
MTTQYTTILKLALPVQGELSGTWGDVVNDNITQMVEQAVAGKAVVNTWTGNSHTLTTADGTTSESRCAILELTDSGTALTGAGTVVCPTNTKLYIVDNNTAEIITVQTAAGTGVAVPVGKTMLVYCDGTNVVEGVTHANSLSLGTSTVTADKILDEDNMASDSATAIATQQSIKAYVDSQVGTVDTLSEILANGNTTGANDIDVDSAQKVQFRDAAIYINSSVDGQLDIVADTEIQIAATTIDVNGTLAFDSLKGTGATTVTNILDEDNMASDSATAIATQQSIKAYVDSQVGSFDTLAEVLAQGNTTGGTDLAVSTGDDITFADSSKAIFGAGSDLEIYHDGSHSYIKDGGTGDLRIWADSPNIATASGNKIFFGNSGYAELYAAGGAIRLATTATGIDVTGFVNTDGIIHTGDTDTFIKFLDNRIYQEIGGYRVLDFETSSSKLNSNDSVFIQTGTTTKNRIKVDQVGDISFYEDTGTTPKFVWDASAESLGIGTSSPAQKLEIFNSSTAWDQYAIAQFTTSAGISGSVGYHVGTSSTTDRGLFLSGSGGTTKHLSVTPTGNVGIGTSTPSKDFVVSNGGAEGFEIDAGVLTNLTEVLAYNRSTSAWNALRTGALQHEFYVSGSERMRIDASGNLLVGTTAGSGASAPDNSATAGDAGVRVSGDGYIGVGINSNPAMYLNRIGTDGSIVQFRKDGTAVGSIGSLSGTAYIAGSSKGLRLGSAGLIPATTTGANSDANYDIGDPAVRFKDLYLSGGVVFGDAGGSGTPSSNTLDSYEEGTFTATLKGSTSEPATLLTTTGYYTKIGRNVTYKVEMGVVDTTGYAGNVTFTGFPFANNSGRHIGTAASYSAVTFTSYLIGLIGGGGTVLEIMDIRSNLAWASGVHNAGATRYIWLSGTYMTS